MEKRTGPTEAQLEAALQGARDMVEAPHSANSAHSPATDAGAPDEFVKRETAVFVPGTHKKPA